MKDTLKTAKITPHKPQQLYVWEEGNMPSFTEYTVNDKNYFDDPDFRPHFRFFPVPKEIEKPKGAVIICLGGAFEFRSDPNEGTPVALAFAQLEYQAFVMEYRLEPYKQQEGALDLARAVRFIRKNADVYNIHPDNISVIGFSAGGIQCGEMLMNYAGDINGSVLDEKYQPDEIDAVRADCLTCAMIYSFYGILCFCEKDVEKYKKGNLPPTYFNYGTLDPFVEEFKTCISLLNQVGVYTEDLVLQDKPHGYGVFEYDWIPAFDRFMTKFLK